MAYNLNRFLRHAYGGPMNPQNEYIQSQNAMGGQQTTMPQAMDMSLMQGMQGNPYSISRSMGQLGNAQPGAPMSMTAGYNQPQYGMGGSPMQPDMPYYGFEQFFQGGGAPSASFMPPMMGQGFQAPGMPQQKPLEGWRWWADKGLDIMNSLAPLAGGAIGGLAGGPAGAFMGNQIGRGIGWLGGTGQELLRRY